MSIRNKIAEIITDAELKCIRCQDNPNEPLCLDGECSEENIHNSDSILTITDNRWYVEEECTIPTETHPEEGHVICRKMSCRYHRGHTLCTEKGKIKSVATIQEILDGKAVKR